MIGGVFFNTFFLFLIVSFCENAPTTTTPSPYEEARREILQLLKYVKKPYITDFLISLLVNEKVARRKDVLNERMTRERSVEIKMDHRERRVEINLADQLRHELNKLISNITALKITAEEFRWFRMKVLYRQMIEDVEKKFPKGSDESYELKKVLNDKKRYQKIQCYYDEDEDQRQQRWLYYAINPPNDQMKEIVKHATDLNITPKQLAYGIARAYKLIFNSIHNEIIFFDDSIKDPNKIIKSKIALRALRAVLQGADLVDELLPDIE